MTRVVVVVVGWGRSKFLVLAVMLASLSTAKSTPSMEAAGWTWQF